jgi:hypothetical protein
MRIGAPQRGHGHERVMVTDGAVGGGGATARTSLVHGRGIVNWTLQ